MKKAFTIIPKASVIFLSLICFNAHLVAKGNSSATASLPIVWANQVIAAKYCDFLNDVASSDVIPAQAGMTSCFLNAFAALKSNSKTSLT